MSVKIISVSYASPLPSFFNVKVISTDSEASKPKLLFPLLSLNFKLLITNFAGAIGLGQVTRPAAYDTIKKEIVDGYLTDDERAYIKRKVPALAKNDLRIKYGGYEGITYEGNPEVQTQLLDALNDTEFNIFVSSMILAQLAERYRDSNGVPKLHQVIAHYNGGKKYGDVSKKYPNAWDAAKAPDLPTETKNYIKKLVGTNGFLDLLTR